MATNDTAPATLMHMLTGYWNKLGIADHLERGPKTSDELARATGTHAQSLYRLIRALSNLDVFEEGESGYFSLTPIGQCLVSSTGGGRILSCLRFLLGQNDC